ncbi:TetR/AcrR family transcriptional regulator [Neobacillus dielmonensis]|uniref:TetR/AcrR family transcriptional regulator n=1 Tax=Neobacillus dielmonensis TaxID=1347369 RepID=UPI0005A5EB34|nr:TetR/AcrR family transcriptional regulator [Neobacillus dielmonensis]
MLKKQLIMEKALELFAKQGFEATSVQQITDYCGISKGAFYLSFKSKDELILALIDYFLSEFISNTDYSVRNTDDDEVLYQFYYNTFDSFQKHSNFAKVLMKEQSHSLNKELFLKMRYYDSLLENIILSMIDRLYGCEIEDTRYDLMFCIKGFMNTFSQFFLFSHLPYDLTRLSQSLVEKTNLLAKQTTIPFISKDMITIVKQSVDETTKENVMELLEQKVEELDNALVKESLILLKQQLNEPVFPQAIVAGLLKNIQEHPHCKWVAYLLRQRLG